MKANAVAGHVTPAQAKSNVRKLPITEHKLIHLLELCIDAEERCESRCLQLRINGHYEQAAYEAQLRDKYSYLKHRVFSAMKDDTSTTTVEQIIQQLASLPVGPVITRQVN